MHYENELIACMYEKTLYYKNIFCFTLSQEYMKRIIASLLLVAYVLGSQFFVKSGYIFSMVGELVNNESIQALTYDQFDSKYSCWKKNTTTALVP